MRTILLLPRQMGKDDLNRKILMRFIRIAFPTPEPNFDDLLNRLDEAEKNRDRKDH